VTLTVHPSLEFGDGNMTIVPGPEPISLQHGLECRNSTPRQLQAPAPKPGPQPCASAGAD